MMFSVEITVNEDDQQHEASFYVLADNADEVSDVVREFDAVGFCPVAEGVIADEQAEFTLPQDRIAMLSHVRQLTRGY